MPLRVYLVGRVMVEADGGLVDERQLPGRQGRLVLAMLGWRHNHPVSRDELVEALWPDGPPASWDTALSAVISKLRQLLTGVGVPGTDTLLNAYGCYELRLPPDAVVDVDSAHNAVHEAETLLRSGDVHAAYTFADIANLIAGRPFLPGEDGLWITARRAELAAIQVRALEAQLATRISKGNLEDGLHAAETLLALEPCRESAYRRLIQLHLLSGNRASALLAYDRCRKTLAEELGVDPCPETEAVYLEALRASI